MNVEDLIRSSLREGADSAELIPDLHETAIARGRRRRSARRASIAGGAVFSIAAFAAGGVVIADNTGGGHHVIQSSDSTTSQQVIADPWWQTWTVGRHNGAVDPNFLANAQPTYDGETQPEQIKAYANGTLPDGTDWVMFTDQSNPHVMQWLQGWDGQPDFGESTQSVTPDITWTSWSTPTLAAHDDASVNQQWLVVVGQPGTTEIDYSPDGTTWQPMDIEDGIAVMKVTTATGFPPATAQVRLSDASGVYATGTPVGAGAGDPVPSVSPTPGEATPTATPTSIETPATAVPSTP